MKKSYLICITSMFLLASMACGEEIKLTYELVKTVEKGYLQGSPPLPKKTEKSITVGLNKNALFLKTNETKTIFDFTQKRITRLRLKEKRYESVPLISIVDFNVCELTNCMAMKKAVAAFGLEPGKMLDSQFNMENVFCVESPNKEIRDEVGKVKKVQKGKEILFEYDGKTIVKFVPSSHSVPKDFRASFRRMLIYVMPMHPQIRHEIQQINVFPETLYVRASHGTIIVSEWKLKSFSKHNENSCVIPKTFTPYIDKDDSLRSVLLMSKNTKPQSKMQVVQLVDEFVEDKQYLDAILAIIEYGFYADDFSREKYSAVFKQTENDEHVRQLMQYVSLCSKNKPSPQAAIKILDKLRKHKLKKGYVLDIWKANWLTDLKKSEQAKQIFLSVLKKNPHLVGVYHDLGNLYRRQYDMPSAWLCWDMALQITPNHSMLFRIKMLKKKLAENFPDFF